MPTKAPRSGDSIPAIPEIPERYRVQLETARRVGYLQYRTCYGSGRLFDLWRAICESEQRLRVAVCDTPRGLSSIIVNAGGIPGGFSTPMRFFANTLLAEHCKRVLWPVGEQCVGSAPSNIALFIARRLVALGSAVQS
jgi:hypothetical protein